MCHKIPISNGRRADWYKALRSSCSIFGCVGSNLTPFILLLNWEKRNKHISLLELIAKKQGQRRRVVSQKIPISNDGRADWSKALRSGSSIFGCRGSNPTPAILLLNLLKRNKKISIFEIDRIKKVGAYVSMYTRACHTTLEMICVQI